MPPPTEPVALFGILDLNALYGQKTEEVTFEGRQHLPGRESPMKDAIKLHFGKCRLQRCCFLARDLYYGL